MLILLILLLLVILGLDHDGVTNLLQNTAITELSCQIPLGNSTRTQDGMTEHEDTRSQEPQTTSGSSQNPHLDLLEYRKNYPKVPGGTIMITHEISLKNLQDLYSSPCNQLKNPQSSLIHMTRTSFRSL